MGLPIVQVDAFTDRPFAGNPAAVCMLPVPADARWMQDVAREMNLSETAFLVRQRDGFDLRWFTPAVEVDLCGHATLASAHVLWQDGHLPPETQARFHTRSGLLTAERRGGSDWIALDFPATRAEPAAAPAGLTAAVGVTPRFVGRSRFDYLLEVDGEDVVRGLKPDFGALARVDARGVIVTSRAAASAYDFVSRFFAPRAGVNEDPVTGSAHCALAPYWTAQLRRADLVGYQASARGGTVRVRLQNDRVILSGQAVTVLRGDLTAGNMGSKEAAPT
jgi:PhzF family phenazine biosynthesis protein